MNTTDTIRLSDRLELRADAESHLIRTLILDGEHAGIVYASAESALVALANPPRYDLPPGVIAGSDGKFYAPGDVVRTLPDEMWERHYNGKWINDGMNHAARVAWFYEVRPTAANLLQPLPAHTFRLPDGELACYRRDAAKLREAGATLRTMTGITPAADYDRHHPKHVLLVEFPAPPKTERVPWWEAVGRKHQVWGPILSVSADGDGAQIETATHSLPADADGMVTVLADGEA